MTLRDLRIPSRLDYYGRFNIVTRRGLRNRMGDGWVNVTPSGGLIGQHGCKPFEEFAGKTFGIYNGDFDRVEDGAGNILWQRPEE